MVCSTSSTGHAWTDFAAHAAKELTMLTSLKFLLVLLALYYVPRSEQLCDKRTVHHVHSLCVVRRLMHRISVPSAYAQ